MHTHMHTHLGHADFYQLHSHKRRYHAPKPGNGIADAQAKCAHLQTCTVTCENMKQNNNRKQSVHRKCE